MTTSPTTPDRPADQLRAAAERARETGDTLHTELGNWLEATAHRLDASTHPDWQWAVVEPSALAVARQLLGTTTCAGVTPSADRRDRYAAAIRETDGWVLDGGQHMIDAVMAVADAEQASLRAEAEGLDEALRGAISASEKDGARLRAELEESRAIALSRCRTLDEHDAAAPPAPADRPVLTDAEGQFLTFALELAADQMALRGDEFDDEDEAALLKFRALATPPATPTT
ncbi:hypothetical protein ACIOJG_20280 [Streptomyces anulatus]